MDIRYFYEEIRKPHAWVNRKFAMQLALRNLLPEHRASWCMTNSTGQVKPPTIIQKISNSSKYYRFYKGLFYCKNGWLCPHCAPSIAHNRSQFIELGIKKWRGERYGLAPSNQSSYKSKIGKELRLALFTIPHLKNDTLKSSVEKIKAAFHDLTHSKGYIKVKTEFGVAGSISILEVTYSKLNGWHPHYHVLLFLNNVVDDNIFKEKLFKLWSNATTKNEFRKPDFEAFGLQNADFASDYLAKHGRQKTSKWCASDEISKWYLKSGNESFTPFDLLEAHLLSMAMDKSLVDDTYIRNNAYRFFEDAGSLFLEFAEAFRGRHQAQWSHGLKELLKPSKEDNIKDVLATVSKEIEKNDTIKNVKTENILYQLNPTEWRQVNKLNARCYFLNNFQNEELINGKLFQPCAGQNSTLRG